MFEALLSCRNMLRGSQKDLRGECLQLKECWRDFEEVSALTPSTYIWSEDRSSSAL